MLLLGDCHSVIETVADNSVQMIYIDPPYATTRQPWDKTLDWNLLWPHFWRVLKNNGAVVVHASFPFTVDLVQTQRQHFKYWWTWHKVRKTGFLNAKRQPLRNVEEICVFYKSQTKYNPQKTPLQKPQKRTSGRTFTSNFTSEYKGGVYTEYDSHHPTTLLTIPCERKSMKPVALCEYMIRTYTDETDVVLDPCMHTGVCGIASKRSNRMFIGIEKEQDFFDQAVKSLEGGV